MGDWIIECCFHFFLSLVLPGSNMMRQTGRPGLGSGWGSCPHSCYSVSSFLSFFLPGSFIILGWGWRTTEGGRAPLFLFLAGAWDLHTEWVVFTLSHRKRPSPSWAQNCGGALPISLSPLTSPRKARQGAAGWVRGEEKLMEMPSGLWRNLRCLGKRLCAWTLAPRRPWALWHFSDGVVSWFSGLRQARALTDLASAVRAVLYEADGSRGLSALWMPIWRREEIFLKDL